MSIELIIVILFFIGIIITAYFMRGAMLHKLKYFAGETNIFDESNLKLKVSWLGRPVMYPGSRITVTGIGRIIVSQKALFVKQYHLKFIIHLSPAVKDKKAWRGYINLYTTPENITFPGDADWTTVRIFVPEAENLFMKKDALLEFNVKETEKLRTALNRNIQIQSNI